MHVLSQTATGRRLSIHSASVRAACYFGVLLAACGAKASENPAADGDATITHVGRISPQILSVTIREGEVTLGRLLPYQPAPGDVITEHASKSVLRRSGAVVGTLTGTATSPARFLREQDGYRGRRADRRSLTDPAAWSLTLDGRPIPILAAYRKSRVSDVADRPEGRPEVCFEHSIFLRTGQPIHDGNLKLVSSDPVIADFNGSLSPQTISDAIHVSMIGFRPDDPSKLAVLSCWMGDGGGVAYQDQPLPPFVLVDDATRKTVYRGQVAMLRSASDPADHRGLQQYPDGSSSNYAGTPTFALDFSDFATEGTYRVVVEGIGSSASFRIARDVYGPLLRLTLDGLDAHRWGETRTIKLADGSSMLRPAATPIRNKGQKNDGANVPIYRTSAIYTNANFGDFEPGNQGLWSPADAQTTVRGGYMDAGDFDRNQNHFIISYLLADLAGRIDNDKAMIDRLLEASRWNVDLWVNLQQADGGIASAVEYAEHPRIGEPSWLNSLPLYVCAPSIESSEHFAISAAKLASEMSLRDESSIPVQRYIDAARRAARWSSAAAQAAPPADAETADLRRAWLLAELWRATDEATYRDELFAIFDRRIPTAWQSLLPDGLSAVLTVLEMPAARSELTTEQRQRLEGSVKQTIAMTYLDGSVDRSPFKTLKNGWVDLSWGNGSWPTTDTANVLRAWKLFGDTRYLAAAVNGVAYAGGGNPLNRVYLTGWNDRSIKNVLHCDTRYSGRAAPAGIPVYGPAITTDLQAAWPLSWHLRDDQVIYPDYQQWPAYENVHEFWNWGMLMEYTTHQSHAAVIYTAGMLDQR